jgi:hypothetical protein
MNGFLNRWDHVPPSNKLVKEENERMSRRQADFRTAAEYVAKEFASVAEVSRIILFGSVAAPLQMEVPRFKRFARHRVEILHECGDMDLAIWLTDMTCLKALNQARARALNQLLSDRNIGVAHHQVDTFILDAETNRYLGRLCTYSACPKGKEECLVPGCGQIPLLRQHEDFQFSSEEALSPNKTMVLFDRETGKQGPL